MSEYWKSTPKYWCKHCSTYVRDTSFERKQHEATAKHQNNLKRFLRDIQNGHERSQREKERAKSEVERLNKVVGASAAEAPHAAPSVAKPEGSMAKKKAVAPQSAADQKRQWAQLAEMGIQVPDGFRAEMAMPSNWSTVTKSIDEQTPEPALSTGVRKRKYEGQEEEEEAGETVARRGWGATTKQYPGDADTDLEDLLSGSLSTKKERRDLSVTPNADRSGITKVEADAGPVEAVVTNLEPPISDTQTGTTSVEMKPETIVKSEASESDGPTSMKNNPVVTTSPLPVFKKRKAKVS